MASLHLLVALYLVTLCKTIRVGPQPRFAASNLRQNRMSWHQIRGGADHRDPMNRFLPVGRIEQVDNAQQAVDRAPSVVMVTSSNCTVFAWAEPQAPLFVADAAPLRLFLLAPGMATLTTGLQADCRLVLRNMFASFIGYRNIFGVDPDPEFIATQIGKYLQNQTIARNRPFATHVLLSYIPVDGRAGPMSFSVSPSGQVGKVKAFCAGTGRVVGMESLQTAFMNQTQPSHVSYREALQLANDTIQRMVKARRTDQGNSEVRVRVVILHASSVTEASSYMMSTTTSSAAVSAAVRTR